MTTTTESAPRGAAIDGADALALGERVAATYALAPPQRLEATTGGRLGRRPGSSLEFQEFREYQPGDDLRHVDWGVYARSDQLVVRRFREEIQPHLDLVLDGSRSMTTPSAKLDGALALAAFLAGTAVAGAFTYRLWWGDDGGRLVADDDRPRDWRLPQPKGRSGLGAPLDRLAGRFRRRGLRVVLSDFLFDDDPGARVARWGRGSAALVLIQVLAAEERHPEPGGFVRLEDSETGERLDLLLDGATVAGYRRALDRHQSAWRAACQAQGALWIGIEAEGMLSAWKGGDDGSSRAAVEPVSTLLRHGLLEPRGRS